MTFTIALVLILFSLTIGFVDLIATLFNNTNRKPKLEVNSNSLVIEQLQQENLRLRKQMDLVISENIRSNPNYKPEPKKITPDERIDQLIADPDCNFDELIKQAELRAEG